MEAQTNSMPEKTAKEVKEEAKAGVGKKESKLKPWHLAIILGVTIGAGIIVALLLGSQGAGGLFTPKPPETPPTTVCPNFVKYVNYGKFRTGQKVKVYPDPQTGYVPVSSEPCYPVKTNYLATIQPLEGVVQMDWGVEFNNPYIHYREVFWKVTVKYGAEFLGWVPERLLAR